MSVQLSTGLPPPIQIPPSQAWQGNDGPWSTFTLGVGAPPQYVRVLVSTSATQPWVVLPEGCPPGSGSGCSISRGGVFKPEESTTWDNQGLYSLLAAGNLGINESGTFALENITLGTPGSELSSYSLSGQIVAGIAADDFWIPSWGIRPDATNLTDLNNHYQSLLSSLKDEARLPSLSYGYTAGANHVYQKTNGGYGSLTLGGYDSSLFSNSSVTYDFAVDSSRDLVVAVKSISTGNSTSLLDKPLNAFIDTGVPHIWLDVASCQLFEDAFQLVYNEGLDLYLVNNTVHEDMRRDNPSVTFTLSSTFNAGSEMDVNITIPYLAFDLELSTDYPGVPQTLSYFPLRRAANFTQYTLGRTFLQHAYLIADYERRTFSVHQTRFDRQRSSGHIETIPPVTLPARNADETEQSPNTDSWRSAPGAIAGLVVGGVLVLTLFFLCAWLWLRRRRARSRRSNASIDDLKAEIDGYEKPGEVSGQSAMPPEMCNVGPMKLEMEAETVVMELQGDWSASELQDHERELEGKELDEHTSNEHVGEATDSLDAPDKEVAELPG